MYKALGVGDYTKLNKKNIISKRNNVQEYKKEIITKIDFSSDKLTVYIQKIKQN